MSSPAIALVGCGAVAQAFHLPALAKHPELMRSLILVDRDLGRARELRDKLGAADAVADHREVVSRVQGAIVATPHAFHYPVTMDFVRQGVHVLCEKPLADNAAEVDEIIAAARQSGVQVAVNQTRRFFSSCREIQRLTTSGELGEIREIRYEMGEPFMWPAATDSFFGAKSGGRGVLFDTGAHIVDLVCWWLGGEPEIVDYADDSRGGTEAVARLTLRRGPTLAHIQLSWLTKLRNVYSITGSRASLSGGVYEWSSYNRRDGGKERKVRTDKASRAFEHFLDVLIENFANVIAGRATPSVSASDVRPAISVIDGCYKRRTLLSEPWHDACERLVAHV